MTDGAVFQPQAIVDLVQKHASERLRVNTFGIGHGADETLVKNTAMAGNGVYKFVTDEADIERTVISSLVSTSLNYQVVELVELLNSKGQTIHSVNPSYCLHSGTVYEFKHLILGDLPFSKQASKCRFIVLNPNNGQKTEHIVKLTDTENQGVLNSVVVEKLKSDISDEQKVLLSETFNVLCPLTALIDSEKL